MARGSTPERGSFEQISFALLLIRALDKRWSGTLTIAPPTGGVHVIELDRGLVSRMIVPDDHARLGDILLEAGVIMETELAAALERRQLLGESLAESRLIDDKTLQRALVLQLLQRLVRVFGFPQDTSWAFEEDTATFDGMPEGVRIDTLRVLWAGLSTHGEMGTWVAATLRRIGESPFRVRRDVNLRRFGFTGDARNLVRCVRDEQCTLRELVDRGLAPEHVAHTIVYVLAITRHLDFAPAGTSKTLGGVEIDDEPSTESVSTTTDEVAADKVTRHDEVSASAATNRPQRVARIKLRRVAMRSEAASEASAEAPAPSESSREGWGRASSEEAAVSSSERCKDDAPSLDHRQQIVTELKSRLARLERDSPFAVLDLDPADLAGLSDDAITDLAWRQIESLSERWHPDNCPPGLAELREGMTRLHDAMNEAFEAIVDPERRRRWLDPASAKPTSTLPSPTGEEDDPPSGRRTSPGASPVQLHERSLVALAQQRYSEALRLCRRAIAARPDEPDYLVTCVWIEAQLGGSDWARLIADLDQVLRDHPRHVTARYYRGVLRRRAGLVEEARRDLVRVLELDEEHDGARRQLERIASSQSSS